ncbi:uncharacterized protein LOC108487913 [Gossypium arboreum]|uniref:uncharacterized protein LOC108487913 n=1 Tax=Gossypium arboreum TaxID=29729 RepID=UPI000819527A|nr:uncharacterized protein LOC108487913 [Gossypium arboreum]
MFAQLSISDDESLLAKLRIKQVMIDQVKSAQLENDKLMKKKKMVQNGTSDNFSIDGYGCLRFHNRICVPNVSELKELILREAHDSPFTLHLGGMKMYCNLQKSYWWPEHQAPTGLLQLINIPERKWECITMDFVTRLPFLVTKKNVI